MVSPQDSVASGTSCCVVVHIFHHHAGEQSSQSLKNKQGILVRTCGWRLNPTKKTHQRKLGKVAGLKNFIHSTGERGERWGNSPRNSSGQPSRELRFTWKWAWERGKMHLYHPSHAFSQTITIDMFPAVLTEIVCSSWEKSDKDKLILYQQGALSWYLSLNIFECLSLFLLLSSGKICNWREAATI